MSGKFCNFHICVIFFIKFYVRRNSKFFTIGISIFVIALCGLFIFTIIGSSPSGIGSFNIKGQTYYSVSFGRFENLAEASREADKIIVRGGAGYIVKDKGYNVLASLYKSKTDADSVAGYLKEANYNATVYEIKIPDIYLKTEFDYSKILNDLMLPLSWLCDLYYKIDDYEITIHSANSEINKIINNLNLSAANFEKRSLDGVKDIRIKAEFKVIINSLENLQLNFTLEDLSLKIKQTQFKILYGIIDLFAEINDKI